MKNQAGFFLCVNRYEFTYFNLVERIYQPSSPLM